MEKLIGLILVSSALFLSGYTLNNLGANSGAVQTMIASIVVVE